MMYDENIEQITGKILKEIRLQHIKDLEADLTLIESWHYGIPEVVFLAVSLFAHGVAIACLTTTATSTYVYADIFMLEKVQSSKEPISK